MLCSGSRAAVSLEAKDARLMLVTKKATARTAVSLYKNECAPLAPKTDPAAPEPNAAPASAPF